MSQGFLLGRVAGIPIRLRWSFLLLLGFVYFAAGGLEGVAAVGIAFASIVLHELGHSLVARRVGVRIGSIDLHFFGGAAQMLDSPRTPRDEIAIAAAGPAVSLALAALGLGLSALVGGDGLLAAIGSINLILGLFNLVPALPMDGGRILRAALTPRLGYARATRIAVTVARVFTVALGVFALFAGAYNLILLAVVLWLLTSAEERRVRSSFDDDRFDPDPRGPVRVVIVRW